MNRLSALGLLACIPLLSACGNEWEWKLTNTVFPYGNARTAGSGVIYVRKVMAPEKGLKTEVKAQETKAEIAAPAQSLPQEKPNELPKSTPLEKELNKRVAK